MNCPKCGHQQTNNVECESCGIIFAKYIKYQQGGYSSDIPRRKANSSMSSGTAFVIGVIVVVLGFMFFDTESNQPSTAASQIEPALDSNEEDIKPSKKISGLNYVAQLEKNTNPNNNIERARTATVFIKSKIGTGSGFFISENCQIITNRHTLMPSEAEILATEEQLYYLEEAVSDHDVAVEEVMAEFRLNCSKCDAETQKSLMNAISDNSRDEFITYIEDSRRNLEEIKDQSRFEVVLADNTQVNAYLLKASNKYDLALLRIENGYCPMLKTTSYEKVDIGDTLYTIGSPIGLKHVVTRGIYSGIQSNEKGDTFIQTDAPINPGNSGGPLIDDTGKVLGINTMIIEGTEGIGFAIPVSYALKEFSRYLK